MSYFNSKLLVYEIAAAAGAEQRAWYNYFVKHKYPLDIHMGATCLDPNVDMFRDPRWGRGQVRAYSSVE